MSEWKEFTGSDEQIEEMRKSGSKGFLLRSSDKLHEGWIFNGNDDFSGIDAFNVTHYLICNPHPLADMICQQTRTGQEVWVLEPIVGTEDHPLWPRLLAEGIYRENVGTAIMENGIFCQYSTRTPYWHINDAQYSFTRFGGYRANK